VAAADEIEFVDITPQLLRARIADVQVLAPTPPAGADRVLHRRTAGWARELAMGWLQHAITSDRRQVARNGHRQRLPRSGSSCIDRRSRG